MMEETRADKKRLVVVSNRLPVVFQKDEAGGQKVTPGAGGLVTALAPVLRDRGGVWMGWLGERGLTDPKRLLADGALTSGYDLKAVELTPEEERKYYFGFSNEILWPLFHDFVGQCNFDPSYWPVYCQVNQKFAEKIMLETQADDYIWVQDYHLIRVARELKKRGVHRDSGFFLHIPFPPLDIFMKMPWRFQVLHGLMDYDLVGFQTMRDRRNFIQCVRTMIPGARVRGSGQVSEVTTPKRTFRVGAFPISIDFGEFEDAAKSEEVGKHAWIIHANLPEQQIILGVDRLDYSKGIPNRMMAMANALERYPELRRKITFLQVVVPSRTDVPEYQQMKDEIERLVGEINGRFTQDGWPPIQYVFRHLNRTELIAHYRTSEIALVTPLRDGMNLVAKEFCASSVEETGVLILSESAGAAVQLGKYALIVNPWDIEGVADAIHQACTMPLDERRARMRKLRSLVRRHDIFRWVNSFLSAAIAKNLNDFPAMEYSLPMVEEVTGTVPD